ncbi:hypothetical protein SC1_01448 [Sphingopyxis sp. C-1]|nr:hypothetical protein SC1_01448 [Sphingopyxis sp. C-1]
MRRSMIRTGLAGFTCLREARAEILCAAASRRFPAGVAPT